MKYLIPACCLTLAALSACSGQTSSSGSDPAPDAGTPVPSAPVPPPVVPELPDVSDRDRDGDRIDDAFGRSTSDDRESIEVILSAPATQAQLDAFVRLGGQVRHVFSAVSYGWTGSIARAQLAPLRSELGSDLHLIAAPKAMVLYLDEATRTGRVRPIWASGFGGLTSGTSGNANITIAILDTGVDGTHPDLSGRMIGWKDYTSDNLATASDVGGHGTHVASIALGSGAAFGVGPGTLQYTTSGNLSSTVAGGFSPGVIHTPSYFAGSTVALTASSTATFLGGVSTTFAFVTSADAGSWSSFSSTTGVSPRTIASATSNNGAARFSDALTQSNPAAINYFAVANGVSNYPAVGDGFGALRGVAPSCKWFGGKVFTDAGAGNSGDIGAALDDMVARRVADNIKVINMSLGTATGTDSTLRAKANTAVNNGIVVVVAAGNGGPGGAISDPGLANKVITVGASNDKNELTTYTSIGAASSGPTTDDKPDLLAPGGSSYRSLILAADSNTKDAASSTFADVQANDYTGKQGTSMATPFVAGAAALLIDALQQSGTTWTLSSSAQPLFVKMLLAASATETNANREQSAGNNPTLGRSASPKDFYEGFGLLNPDAAIEAFTTALPSSLTGSVSNTLPARLEWERRAWGRKVSLINGATATLSLAVPSTADFDLYLYSASPDGNGAPVLRAASSTAGLDSDEAISFTSSTTETAYVFVKRVTGYGSFTLTGSTSNKCGNGTVDSGEECDPGVAGASTCCSASCQNVTAGTACNDGNACTQTDTCSAGLCVGSNSVTCSASDQCHNAGTCNPSTGVCSSPAKSDGTTCNDGNACTQSDTCVVGICVGASPKTCTASDQCHAAGTCNPSTGACSNPAKSDGSACNDGNACTQTDTCVAGTCNGTNPKTCAASDQCHTAGTCNASTGACSNPAKSDGSTCNDGNACTQSDTCVAGACTGASPKTCAALDQCHSAGSCDPSTGACSNPTKGDGSACNDGNACTQSDSCISGTCLGASPVTCATPDQCHSAGTCNPSTGACTNPAKSDGSSCNDGNACTQSDTCVAGTCTGANPKACTATDQCHGAGVCDPSNGACSSPALNGTACSDGDACTQTDTCVTGVCTGSNPKTCAAAADCQPAGTCSSQTGQCSAPIADDGTPCSKGTCSSGLCVAPMGGAGGGTNGAAGSAGEASGGMGGAGGDSLGLAGDGSEAGEPGQSAAGSGGQAGSVARAGSSASADAGAPDSEMPAQAGASSSSAQQDSGCGCSEAGSSPRAPSAWWALGGLIVVAAHRRRKGAAIRVA